MRPPPRGKSLKWLRQVRPGYAWLLGMILSYLIASGFRDIDPVVWAAGLGLRVATFALALAVIMVFLILAAQYERWSLPLAVLTAVPFAP